MFYTTTSSFRILCRLVLFCFTFAPFHPANLQVPSAFAFKFSTSSETGSWTVDFGAWTLDLGPSPAYGKTQELLLASPPNPTSRKEALTESRSSSSMVRLPGHVLPALAKATLVKGKSTSVAEQRLTLTLVLKHDDQAGFEQYLHEVYDPQSTSFREFLTQSELSDRFGPSQKTYDDVLSYLQNNGFSLVKGAENHLTLTVRGTRAQAERTFAVHIRDYKIGDKRFFANDADPAVPPSLAGHIQATMGLSTLAVPSPTNSFAFGEAIARAYLTDAAALEALVADAEATGGVPGVAVLTATGAIYYRWVSVEVLRIALQMNVVLRAALGNAMAIDQRFAVNTPALNTGQKAAPLAFNNDLLSDVANWLTIAGPSASLAAAPPLKPPATGAGQKIGVLAFSNFRPSDIADWLALSGKPASLINQVSQVHVNGGAPFGPGESDVLLGIQTLLTVAPGAQVVVYDGPFNAPSTSFQDIFSAMINDHVTVISNSFVYCEDQTTPADVQSLDSILATAAASGISVFNATGDAGSACKDGSSNTIAVPANSPNATAVGGTSLKVGPGSIYSDESWWDGSTQLPPTGQGGFGVSRFFSQPFYQSGLIGGPMRSVPDVVAPADPQTGPVICQADAGGCPTGRTLGGTSLATPFWAGLAALLNHSEGQNLGFLNPQLYLLAGTNAFHSAAKLHSDVAHVGLGSPNGNLLSLGLGNVAVGPTDAAVSSVTASFTDPFLPFSGPVQANGTAAAAITVLLRDSDGNQVAGKTVTLTANAGSHAVISPPSGVSNIDNGAVVFTVTNLTAEPVTFTATDTTDGLVLQDQPTVIFSVPPATSAGINAFPATVTADGSSAATITVTLKDALNRPTPGKLITLAQGNGHSRITGPNPTVTDTNGQIVFSATDLVNEVVTYTAVDVTDGNLPVPGTGVVTFNNGSGTACGQGTTPPVGLNGYTVTPFITGFPVGALSFSNVNYGGCSGVSTPAFLNGNIYVPNFFNGDVFKLGAGGGATSNANKLTTIGPTLGWFVVGKDGRLYAARAGTGGNFNTGIVVELDPNTGLIARTLATGLTCPQDLVVDPLSGDLFFDDVCFGAGSDNASLFRVRNPSSTTPTLEVYATLPFTPNGQIVFSPKGTIYAVTNYTQQSPPVVRVSGTNGSQPPTVTSLAGVASNFWVNIGNVDASGEATKLITLQNGKLQLTDITTNPPTVTATLTDGVGGGIIGPDGCLYMPNQDTVYKLTDPTGGCNFLPTNAAPSITLTPTTVSPNPAQGTSQTFTANIRNLSVPAGTPVRLEVIGPNLNALLARTDANGQAVFTYTGTLTGTDIILATATVGTQTLLSNKARVTWVAGKHATFLTLNPSPTSGTPNQSVTVVVSLTDSSITPTVPVVGVAVTFTLGSAQCVGTTDSNGIASCTLTPSVAGTGTLSASFIGNAQFLASSDAVDFTVIAAAPVCTPSAEVCDGKDNNCNGQIDEGNPGGGAACNTGRPGGCSAGVLTCTNGALVCQQTTQPSSEVCDGKDNNCNGQVDEGFGTLSCGVGACARTVNACVNGVTQACAPGTPAPEVCDGLDNNCNGQVDDGLGTLSCGVGACARTVNACVNGVTQACTPGTPAPEICDGVDNNCSGQIDEGLSCTPPPTVQCPHGQGYWKNQAKVWPVTSLKLGSQTYSQAELLKLLGSPSTGDASLILAKQLIAAKLNIAAGVDSKPIATTITDADQQLNAFRGKLPYAVKTSSTAGKGMNKDADKLESFNEGELTRQCKEHDKDDKEEHDRRGHSTD